MGDDFSDRDLEDLDFTIARRFTNSDLLTAIQNYMVERCPGEIQVNRSIIESNLSTEYDLSKEDAERLFTGLVMNGAAKQTEGGHTFSDYTFRVDTELAVDILEIQRVARVAIQHEESQKSHINNTKVELIGTFPDEASISAADDIGTISDNIRNIILDAESNVKIANPYFDPSPAVVGDIASLANRGVQTEILTRETSFENAGLQLSLNSMYESLDQSSKGKLSVRDLYRMNSTTGRQEFATHAKVVVVDREICYIGSANLTETSLGNNFELGVLLRGELVEKISAVYDDIFEYASPVSLPI